MANRILANGLMAFGLFMIFLGVYYLMFGFYPEWDAAPEYMSGYSDKIMGNYLADYVFPAYGLISAGVGMLISSSILLSGKTND